METVLLDFIFLTIWETLSSLLQHLFWWGVINRLCFLQLGTVLNWNSWFGPTAAMSGSGADRCHQRWDQHRSDYRYWRDGPIEMKNRCIFVKAQYCSSTSAAASSGGMCGSCQNTSWDLCLALICTSIFASPVFKVFLNRRAEPPIGTFLHTLFFSTKSFGPVPRKQLWACLNKLGCGKPEWICSFQTTIYRLPKTITSAVHVLWTQE